MTTTRHSAAKALKQAQQELEGLKAQRAEFVALLDDANRKEEAIRSKRGTTQELASARIGVTAARELLADHEGRITEAQEKVAEREAEAGHAERLDAMRRHAKECAEAHAKLNELIADIHAALTSSLESAGHLYSDMLTAKAAFYREGRHVAKGFTLTSFDVRTVGKGTEDEVNAVLAELGVDKSHPVRTQWFGATRNAGDSYSGAKLGTGDDLSVGLVRLLLQHMRLAGTQRQTATPAEANMTDRHDGAG